MNETAEEVATIDLFFQALKIHGKLRWRAFRKDSSGHLTIYDVPEQAFMQPKDEVTLYLCRVGGFLGHNSQNTPIMEVFPINILASKNGVINELGFDWAKRHDGKGYEWMCETDIDGIKYKFVLDRQVEPPDPRIVGGTIYLDVRPHAIIHRSSNGRYRIVSVFPAEFE